MRINKWASSYAIGGLMAGPTGTINCSVELRQFYFWSRHGNELNCCCGYRWNQHVGRIGGGRTIIGVLIMTCLASGLPYGWFFLATGFYWYRYYFSRLTILLNEKELYRMAISTKVEISSLLFQK